MKRGAERVYIFLTDEGTTYQPGSEQAEPDIANCQLIGIAAGRDQVAAFRRLVATQPWLAGSSFDVVYCYELAVDYLESRREFSLKALGSDA